MSSTPNGSTTATGLDRLENKFSPMKPLRPKYFVGRREQVLAIFEAGQVYDWQPKVISLRGPQKIGRTSLLQYVQVLAKGRGNIAGIDTNYAVAFKHRIGALACPYVDMRLVPGATETSVTTNFVNALANSLAVSLLDSHGFPEVSGSSVQLVKQMNRPVDGTDPRYVLLIDRAEILLQEHMLQSLHGLLGALNEGVPGLSLLFSFGTSDGLSGLDVMRRAVEIDDCIAAISSLLNVNDEKVDVGLLRTDEINHFLLDDWFTQAGQPADSPFSESEIEWIQMRAGGHPAALQVIGKRLYEEKFPRSAPEGRQLSEVDLSEVETMALRNLKSLVKDSWDRLDPLARRAAASLASTPDGISDPDGFSANVLRILEGEGIVRQQSNFSKIEMPSSLIRELIRGNMDAGDGDRIHLMSAREREEAQLVVSVNGESRVVALTEKEATIVERLLQAPKDGVVGNEELYLTIWGRIPPKDDEQEELRWQQRLTQRIKGLRKKLQHIMGENPVKNEYGRGYRIVGPERFRLPSTREAG